MKAFRIVEPGRTEIPGEVRVRVAILGLCGSDLNSVGAPATFVSRVVALEEAGAALAQWSADPGGVSKIHVDVGGVL
jgi:hypothetical protein